MASIAVCFAPVWALASHTLFSSPQLQTGPLGPRDLAALVEDRLDAAGCIQAIYENDISHDRYLMGFNLADRSWYKIHRGAFLGFTPATGYFKGEEGESAQTNIPEGKLYDRWPHEYLPSLYVLAVCEMEEVFRDIQPTPGGGVVATLELPDGQPMRQELLERWLSGTRPVDHIQTIIEVDGSGLLRRVDSAIDALDRVVQYADDSPLGLPLVSYYGPNKPGGLQLISFTYDPAGCPAAFMPSGVERLAKEARTGIVVRRLGTSDGQPGSVARMAATAPAAPGPIERASKPLALAALLTIAVGAFAWWRNRR